MSQVDMTWETRIASFRTDENETLVGTGGGGLCVCIFFGCLSVCSVAYRAPDVADDVCGFVRLLTKKMQLRCNEFDRHLKL